MPKINHEEYEILKGLDDKWKWIARDGECNSLNVFSVKPIKVHSQWDYVDVGYKHVGLTKEENKMFQFIQWEDSEPYNIQELIEEYEKDYKGSWEHAIEFSKEMRRESEETEVKNIEELKSWFEDDKLYVGEYVKHKINQLDEPEVLSQEWIDEHKVARINNLRKMTTNDVVPVKDLQNLLVSKQEEVKVPQFIANYLPLVKEDVELERASYYAVTNNELPKWKKEYDWIRENFETFVKAWLAYPNIEVEEEQKYYAKLKKPTPPKKEWMSNLSGSYYWMIDDRGLRIGEYLSVPVGLEEDASIYTLEDWNRYGINDDNADFVKVEELEE